jgi:hypothetical protein
LQRTRFDRSAMCRSAVRLLQLGSRRSTLLVLLDAVEGFFELGDEGRLT